MDGGLLLKWFGDEIIPLLAMYSLVLSFIPAAAFFGLILAISLVFASIMKFMIYSEAKCGSFPIGVSVETNILVILIGGFLDPMKKNAAAWMARLFIAGFSADATVTAAC